MQTHTKTILARTLTVMYIFAIAFFCFANIGAVYGTSFDVLGIPGDKIAHFIMFLPFPILAFLSFEHEKKSAWASIKFTLETFFVGIMIAACTEVIQGKLPYRALEIADFYADSIAISVCCIYVLCVDLTRHSKKLRKSK